MAGGRGLLHGPSACRWVWPQTTSEAGTFYVRSKGCLGPAAGRLRMWMAHMAAFPRLPPDQPAPIEYNFQGYKTLQWEEGKEKLLFMQYEHNCAEV